MILGAHESTSGGFHRAMVRGAEDGAECVQIFCKSPRQWRVSPLSQGEIEKFKEAREKNRIKNCLVHASYLLNLGDPEEKGFKRSLNSLREEVIRTAQLGIEGIVFHPGAHKKSGEENCLKRIASALTEIFQELDIEPPILMLETTAGQGTNVGYRFEHLAQIIEYVPSQFRKYLKVCFDTAHVFAAGYDLRTEEGYHKVFEEFDSILGLDNLYAFHLNDSLKPYASRVDRHANIGEGELGIEPFKWLVNDPRFAQIPGYLETPPLDDGSPSFAYNLKVLRSLIE